MCSSNHELLLSLNSNSCGYSSSFRYCAMQHRATARHVHRIDELTNHTNKKALSAKQNKQNRSRYGAARRGPLLVPHRVSKFLVLCFFVGFFCQIVPHPVSSMFARVSFFTSPPLRHTEITSIGGSCPTALKNENGAKLTVPSIAFVDTNPMGRGTTERGW